MDVPSSSESWGQSIAPSPVILPDELIIDILTFLNAKSLMLLRSVSKSWNALISDPTFIKMHLNRSARNPHFVRFFTNSSKEISVVFSPVRRLLENRSITLANDQYSRLKVKNCRRVVGSCNGLLCLLGFSLTTEFPEIWLCFWNPATRTSSEKLGFVHCHVKSLLHRFFKFMFGYDNSTGTYKVVWLRYDPLDSGGEAKLRTEVRVFSLGDNVWRNIQSVPVVPLHITYPCENDGVYLNGSLNWLAFRNYSLKFCFTSVYDWDHITVEQFVIISLDLGTETYRQLLPPPGFDEVPIVEPAVSVLMGCLCFSHDFKRTHFVIWKMTEFGVEESWTQFFKINYQNIEIHYPDGHLRQHHCRLVPLCLSENGDTLILASDLETQAILYNWRDNRSRRARITNEIYWPFAKDYVESLVLTFENYGSATTTSRTSNIIDGAW